MKQFLAGLASGAVGFFIWITVSVVYGVTEGIEVGLIGESGSPPTMFWWIATPSFLLMIGGPLWFWLIGPLWSLFKRRERK